MPKRFWLVTFERSETVKAIYAVVLPEGAIVEPKEENRR